MAVNLDEHFPMFVDLVINYPYSYVSRQPVFRSLGKVHDKPVSLSKNKFMSDAGLAHMPPVSGMRADATRYIFDDLNAMVHGLAQISEHVLRAGVSLPQENVVARQYLKFYDLVATTIDIMDVADDMADMTFSG
jgi:hypothetical protein